MTTIYLLRHSKPYRDNIDLYKVDESTQISNEKNILSVDGELLAKQISEKKELNNIDIIYSSHYVRAMSTAKYIAYNNNLYLNVDERLGERCFGNVAIKDLPKDYFERQYVDWNYKLEGGESLNDTSKRMNNFFDEVLKNNQNKNIAIVSHGTAITSMLKKYCNIIFNDKNKTAEIYFNNKMVFDGSWKCPELFRLEFEGNKLINIENIK